MTQPFIEAFFDEPTNTISYLVGDPATRTAAVIDPVLDFDLASGLADTSSAERILGFAQAHDWRIAMVLETHAHADHLSAAPFIKARTGAWIGIGTHIRDVQRIFFPMFAMTGPPLSPWQRPPSVWLKPKSSGSSLAIGLLMMWRTLLSVSASDVLP